MVPTASALPPRSLAEVARLVVEGLCAAPSASVSASRGALRGRGAWGRLSQDPCSPETGAHTTYDLASVTKPFTAVLAARMVRRGVLGWGEPLGALVPALARTRSADVPLELFAAHRAGLAAHLELFAPTRTGGRVDPAVAARTAADARRDDCVGPPPPEGFAPVYSDMGYLLFGLALEARGGAPLDALVRDEILRPLGLDRRVGSARQLRTTDPSFDARVAPTEEQAFRGGVVRGVVHDENAWSITGDALAGHAGLFGDAESVTRFGEAILDALSRDTGWLGPDDLAPLLRVRPGGTLRAGFDGRSGERPSSGARLGARTFGHLGFTGTSLWIDPDTRFVGTLLTNRVHPTREHVAIRAARPLAYDAMFDALEPRE